MNRSAWNLTWIWTGLGGSWIWKNVLELEGQGFKSEKNQTQTRRTSKKNLRIKTKTGGSLIYLFLKDEELHNTNTTLQIKWVPGKF